MCAYTIGYYCLGKFVKGADEAALDPVPGPYLLPKITLSSEHRKLIEDSLKQMIGEWSGIGADNLEHTSTYGIRAYLNSSTLHSHVDRCETHILSAVYCVDDSYPVGVKRWPMVADGDLTGKRVSVVRFQRRRARHFVLPFR